MEKKDLEKSREGETEVFFKRVEKQPDNEADKDKNEMKKLGRETKEEFKKILERMYKTFKEQDKM